MNRSDRYRYPAILGYDVPTGRYYVLWPDLPGCTTTADTEDQALGNAQEAMSLHLWGMEDDGDPIPPPTPIQHLNLSEYEEDGNKFVVILVEILDALFPGAYGNQTEKRTGKCLGVKGA